MRHRRSAAEQDEQQSQELFRSRLDGMIALSHPLVKLSDRMPWEAITDRVARVLPPTPVGAGRASLPVRLMVGLLYLKHAYNVSDERLVVGWLENPYWQYFCGEVYFQTELPWQSPSPNILET